METNNKTLTRLAEEYAKANAGSVMRPTAERAHLAGARAVLTHEAVVAMRDALECNNKTIMWAKRNAALIAFDKLMGEAK